MDSQSKRREVTALIDNIKDHSDRLRNHDSIPLLEMSVILSKINRLHEATLILKYLLAKDQHHEEEEFGSSNYITNAFVKDPKTRLKELEAEEKEEEKEEQKVEAEQSSESAIGEVQEEKPEPEENVSIDEVIEKLEKEEVNSLPDLNEQYLEEEDNSLGEQLQKQPIADLVAAIGLNERYLYANELFEGDIDAFRSELSNLNNFNSKEEADQYFNEDLARKRGWNKDHEMVHALKVLIERRYL